MMCDLSFNKEKQKDGSQLKEAAKSSPRFSSRNVFAKIVERNH